LVHIAPDHHRTTAANPDHTSGADNYLYADGHVSAIKAATFKKLLDSGENTAKPRE
jgi:prepilin-type processing-associated H-X9-DG protein